MQSLSSALRRGCNARSWKRLLVRLSTALVLHISYHTARASCYPAGIGFSDAGGCVPDVASMAPQDFPLRSDGPTVKAGNYPFKFDPLTISILGERPYSSFFSGDPNVARSRHGRISIYCCQTSHP